METINISKLLKQYNLPISFKDFQPNPSSMEPIGDGKWHKFSENRSDCATRAICALTNERYDDVVEMQFQIAKKYRIATTHPAVTEEMLAKYGYYKHELKEPCTGYAFILAHPKGHYAITIRDHIYAVIDGCVYDTFYHLLKPDKIMAKFDRMLGEKCSKYFSKDK